jgi:Tfp pilus assembly protein PilE
MVHPKVRRKGLTLIELVVVLVILIALAAILVPMLPGMLGRAHTASSATNISEINKFVQTYEQLYQSHASDFDALMDEKGALADYLPGGAAPAGGAITKVTLNAAQANALTNAGITRLQAMELTAAADPWNPTFNPYNGAVISIASGSSVAQVSEKAVEQTGAGLVNDPGGINGDVYVIVGLGKRCTMIGKVMADAPTHFGENQASNAANVYSRYCLVFRVTRGGATPQDLERAVFIGTVAVHDDGIGTADSHIEEYYNITRSQ